MLSASSIVAMPIRAPSCSAFSPNCHYQKPAKIKAQPSFTMKFKQKTEGRDGPVFLEPRTQACPLSMQAQGQLAQCSGYPLLAFLGSVVSFLASHQSSSVLFQVSCGLMCQSRARPMGQMESITNQSRLRTERSGEEDICKPNQEAGLIDRAMGKSQKGFGPRRGDAPKFPWLLEARCD